MTVIKIGANEIGGELRARARKTPGELTKAMVRSARRGRAMLVRRTPKDLGQAKAGWRVSTPIKGTKGARVDLYNDNPYVGILELGARPHKVSMEGRIAIFEWVERHYGLFRVRTKTGRAVRRTAEQKEQEIWDITNAIVRKIRREGQKGKYFVAKSMDELNRGFGAELGKQIAAYARRRAKRGGGKK